MALREGSGKPLSNVRKCSEKNMGQNLRADLLEALASRDHHDGFLLNFSHIFIKSVLVRLSPFKSV